MVAGSHTVIAATNPKLPYDTEHDLVAVAQLFRHPFDVLVINSAIPAKTLPEFVALTKDNPTKYNYATTGRAGQNHLVIERLKMLSGMKIEHVPYRGGAPAMLAVVRGRRICSLSPPRWRSRTSSSDRFVLLRWAGSSATSNTPMCRPPTSRVIRVCRRCPGFGLFAPRGTPRPIVERINAEVNAALRDPGVAARFSQQGVEVEQSNPDEFQKQISVEIRNWTEVARSANITVAD